MFRRRKKDGRADNPYEGLRSMALDAVASGTVTATAQHAQVLGVITDVPMSGGAATVVALSDGTTSMYTSTGGGTIGGGGHAHVAAATHALLLAAEQQLSAFAGPDDDALPPAVVVRFHVLTASGRLRADVPEAAFWGKEPHPLVPVIAAAQNVISALRTTTPG